MQTKYDLAELKRCLNAKAPRRGARKLAPYVQVEFRPVKETRCLQLTDILIGAVGAASNGAIEDTPKGRIIRHIQEQCPVSDLSKPTDKHARDFNIWHFRLGA